MQNSFLNVWPLHYEGWKQMYVTCGCTFSNYVFQSYKFQEALNPMQKVALDQGGLHKWMPACDKNGS